MAYDGKPGASATRGGNPPCRSRARLSADGLAGGIRPLGTARSARHRPRTAATNTGCTRPAVLAGRASIGAAADRTRTLVTAERWCCGTRWAIVGDQAVLTREVAECEVGGSWFISTLG